MSTRRAGATTARAAAPPGSRGTALSRSTPAWPAEPTPGARTLGDLVAEYVRTPVGRKRDKDGYPLGTDWSPAYHTSVTHGLARAGRSGARPTTGHASRGGSQIRAAALGRRSSTRTD
ncbi:hypothetical protein [Cellulomonas chengniuliangii]|uniref:hypothetical protein n=1 Tax=Cellulomonas chengniuliangii TaxID=2968084 RepID=UPI001D0E7E09|nr:hypothetical protein [Cellulomonas chengniuliangii]MCC2317139.1 hypothetical protein [Cellulomonas chengniuliangii]